MVIKISEDKPELSEINKRRKPLPKVGHLFFLLIGILFVVLPWYFFTTPRFDKSGFIICMPVLIIIGFLWSLVSIVSFVNPKSDYHKFRRSGRESEGEIIHRYIDIIRTWEWGKREETKYYHVVFKYEAQRTEGTKKTITLDAQVDEHLYNSHEIGSKVKVHYASEDPSLVYLEGETLWFGRPA